WRRANTPNRGPSLLNSAPPGAWASCPFFPSCKRHDSGTGRMPLHPENSLLPRRLPRLIGTPQVRPSFLCQCLRLRPAPGGDVPVVARAQDLGNLATLEAEGARVVGVFEKAVLEALLVPGGLPAHHAGQQAHAGVDKYHGAEFSAGEHV